MAKYEPTDTITFEATQVVLSQAACAALIEFASTDDTRPHLGVGINDGSLCATDGPTLLRFDAPQCEPVRAKDLHGKVWSREYVVTRLAIAKASKADVVLEMSFFQEAAFPPVGQVVPEPGFGKGKSGVKVNPMYLARMCKVTKACETQGVLMVSMRGELDPIMYTCVSTRNALKATIVIMPMRI